MRLLLRKIILWALSAVEPPNMDPTFFDKKRSEGTPQ